MTRLGVSGHQDLPPVAVEFARRRLREIITETEGPLIGISSLAAGADQLFAAEVIGAGGLLWVVIPSVDYETTLAGDDLAQYWELLGQADQVENLAFPESTEAAYDAAGRRVVDRCDVLVAVWDGLPARGLGGTGDAVAYARQIDRTTMIVWPDGVVRD